MNQYYEIKRSRYLGEECYQLSDKITDDESIMAYAYNLYTRLKDFWAIPAKEVKSGEHSWKVKWQPKLQDGYRRLTFQEFITHSYQAFITHLGEVRALEIPSTTVWVKAPEKQQLSFWS